MQMSEENVKVGEKKGVIIKRIRNSPNLQHTMI